VVHVGMYATMPAIINLVLDTVVFMAISLRMVSLSIRDDTFSAIMKSFFRGDGLPSLSRSLLHSGQLYYWSVVILVVSSPGFITLR
jgi:hypothetical protein